MHDARIHGRGAMGLLSKLFGSKKDSKKGPPEQELEVHFSYGSTSLQHLYALEDLVRTAIVDAAVGHYEGHDVAADGSDGRFYMYGPDAEAMLRVIDPVLTASPLMRGATVTLWFGTRSWRTPKRVIELPS
jgi:hypothetical protein